LPTTKNRRTIRRLHLSGASPLRWEYIKS
jgi:hypothetical protein